MLIQAVNVMFLACSRFDGVVDLYQRAKAALGEILSAFEFMDDASMDISLRNLRLKSPLSARRPFYVLIETHGSNPDHDQQKVYSFLDALQSNGLVDDGTIAQDEKQAADIWHLRESLGLAFRGEGSASYKYDLTLPMASYYALVDVMRARLSGRIKSCVAWGHIGDSNLHLNIALAAPDPETLALIEPFVYEFTSQARGSISAEHGIGQYKPHHLHYSRTAAEIAVMRTIKAALDPRGILNPHKVIPPEC